jgi:hypothetical protein
MELVSVKPQKEFLCSFFINYSSIRNDLMKMDVDYLMPTTNTIDIKSLILVRHLHEGKKTSIQNSLFTSGAGYD